MSEAEFTLLIRLSNGQRIEVSIEGEGGSSPESTSITVLKVKECIAKKDSTAPASRQRLIYKGRILENERTLSDYDIPKGATLFMVKAAAPSSAPPTPAAGGATANTTTASSPGTNSTSPSVPRPSSTTTMPPMMRANNNPFGMPRGMGGAGAQGGIPNPEQMQQMLNSPHMQGLLDNPDLLGSILEHSMQTPQMQQLMEQNPELRQLYSDPAMIQQAIQMMRNPQHMQQVMRQQDLAMSQLENMPGGFAALSNMYRNVQEPMMEAQQASRQTDAPNGPSRNSGGTDGATGAAMPNPWGAPAANQNNTRRTTPSSSASSAQALPFGSIPGGANPFGGGGMPNPWAGAAGGGGGSGLPGMPPGMPMMPGMPPGGQPNMDQMMQMLDNPVMSQMMNDMVQNNPDMIRTMLEAQNPMMRQMFQGNPEMANNFIRNMFNPTNMRSMMEMQRNMAGGAAAGGGMPNFGAMGAGGIPNFGAMGGMPGLFGMMPPPGSSPGVAGGGGANAGDLDFSTLLTQFQQTGLNAGAPPAPPANPADRYRTQLQALYGMGFDDEQRNLAALQAGHGNLNRAVDHLLSAPMPAAPSPAPAPSPASTVALASASGSSSAEDASSPSQESPPPETDSSPKDATEKKND